MALGLAKVSFAGTLKEKVTKDTELDFMTIFKWCPLKDIISAEKGKFMMKRIFTDHCLLFLPNAIC